MILSRLSFDFDIKIFVHLNTHIPLPQMITLLDFFIQNSRIFMFNQIPKKRLLNPNSVHNNLKNLDEFLLIDKISIKTKLFNRPQNSQFLVDL